jgi:hypothetical protein
MDRIWANRLEAGDKTWAEVPARRKPGVRTVLLDDVSAGKLTPEKYQEIVGEAYPLEEGQADAE